MIAPLVRILTDLVLVALVSRYLLKRLARASAHTPSAQTDSAAVSDESRREACVCEADASHTSLKHHPLEVGGSGVLPKDHPHRPTCFKIYCDMHAVHQSSAQSWRTCDSLLEQTDTPSTFKSSDEFSVILRHLQAKHSQLMVPSTMQVNWRVFRQGVMPCWEDPNNALGGKWAVSFTNGTSASAMEPLQIVIDSILQGSFPQHHLVTGVVLSVKHWGYRLSIWTSSIPSNRQVFKGCRWLRRLQPNYWGWYTHGDLQIKSEPRMNSLTETLPNT